AWEYVVRRADGSHLVHLPGVLARTLERRELVRDRNRYREEVEALALALRGTTDGVVVLDPGGRVAFVNPALAHAWRQPESTIVGRFVGDFVGTPGGQADLGDVLVAVGERGSWNGELRTRGIEPPQGVWDVTLTPLGCPAPAPGHARTAVGIFRDMSEKYALEQLRADFLSMITHDIKVPLTVILGYTEMLTDPEPPPDQIPPDILTRIRESGETIHALVCNFLDLSRIEAGRMTLDRRPFDLTAMLAHAVEHYGSTARRKGVRLALETEPLPPLVADETQLQRVVTNLLGNAIKYTATGGRVTVSTAREDGRVAVAFRGLRRRLQRHVLRRAPGTRDGIDHACRVHGLGQAGRLDEVEHGRQLAPLGTEHVAMHLEEDPAARIARELDRLVDDVDRRAV